MCVVSLPLRERITGDHLARIYNYNFKQQCLYFDDAVAGTVGHRIPTVQVCYQAFLVDPLLNRNRCLRAQHNNMDAKGDWSFTTENTCKVPYRRYPILIVDRTFVSFFNLRKKIVGNLSCTLQSRISRHGKFKIS